MPLPSISLCLLKKPSQPSNSVTFEQRLTNLIYVFTCVFNDKYDPTNSCQWMIYKQKKCITKCSCDFHLKKMSFHFGHTTFDILLLSPPKQATTTLLKQSYSPLSLKTSGTSSLDSVPTKGILKFAQIFSHFLGPIFKLVPFFSNQMPWKKTTRRSFSISVLHYVLLCFV